MNGCKGEELCRPSHVAIKTHIVNLLLTREMAFTNGGMMGSWVNLGGGG